MKMTIVNNHVVEYYVNIINSYVNIVNYNINIVSFYTRNNWYANIKKITKLSFNLLLMAFVSRVNWTLIYLLF